MKRCLVFLLIAALLLPSAIAVNAPETDALQLSADSAVLVEQQTGTILYEKDAHTHRSPASVTKVMTMLLIAEAVDSGALALTDTVTATEHAASMGGSQIWLEEGESMTVDEMLKCIAVASANDCAVAMAEKLAGSESAFAERMNQRAAELGMADTHFINCTGLTEDEAHYTSAYDIALMSAELLKHEWIQNYTTIWMEEVPDGAIGLTNTNRLVRSFDGATGLKTGFTSQAMYCLSASAQRDGVQYIAVVLHAPSSQERFTDAQTLLNYAFANYDLWSAAANVVLPPVKVTLGECESIQPVCSGGDALVVERSGGAVTWDIRLPEEIDAPVHAGQTLGTLVVQNDRGTVAELPIIAPEDVAQMGLWQLWTRVIGAL